MFRIAALAVFSIALVGCAPSARRADLAGARSLCAGDGSVSVSKGSNGRQILCGLEEMVGTHIPKCVCRNETDNAEARESAQDAVRSAEQARRAARGN